MKMKKIVVPRFEFKNEFGFFQFHNVTVLVASDSGITAENFNQKAGDHSVSSVEIEKMGREAAQRFFADRYSEIIRGDSSLTQKEVNGIRIFLGANNSELADLLNLDKSTITRIIKGETAPQGPTQFLLMERLRNELEAPGTTKAILQHRQRNDDEQVTIIGVSAKEVSEWFIRRFTQLEDCITNLKLQKLLYYAQGVAVGRYGCRLIAEDFYAWEHGPVIKEIYHIYRGCGSSALFTSPTADLSSLEQNKVVVSILNDTMSMYGKFGAWVLREKTHSEAPWLSTEEKQLIEFSKIKDFFSHSLI